jgi:hypothetical protein
MVLKGLDVAAIKKKHFYMSLYWKKKSPKTNRPISIKVDADYPCVRPIHVCLNKGTYPHQRGDNHKKCKYREGSFKKKSSQEPVI